MKVESYFKFTTRPREVISCVPRPCEKCCEKNGCMYATPAVQQSCLKDECRHKLPNCPSCCNGPGKYLISNNIDKKVNNIFSALVVSVRILHNLESNTQYGNLLFQPIPSLQGNFEHIFCKTNSPVHEFPIEWN